MKIFHEWLKIVLGLLVFAFGVHLTIYANIGLAPWDCLGMGISYHTPHIVKYLFQIQKVSPHNERAISYGVSSTFFARLADSGIKKLNVF